MVDPIRTVLMTYVSSITADSVLRSALRRAKRAEADLEARGLDRTLIDEMVRGLEFFLEDPAKRSECHARLTALSSRAIPPTRSSAADIEIPIADEVGIVDARTQARSFARDLGFDRADQAKIATSVSELARNMYAYGGPGTITLSTLSTPRPGIRIHAADEGPGIANLDQIMKGAYQSKTGMGLGIVACKRLMDEFEIDTGPGRGTKITLHKYLR